MTTLWVWGTGWVTATLAPRERAPGLDRCGYPAAPHLRCGARLFVPLAGPWLLGRGCAGRRRCGEPGGWCEGAHSWSRPTARAGALRASGDMSSRAGTSLCGRGRSTPSGTGILSPNAWAVPAWSGWHLAARNVPAGVGGTVVRGHHGSLQSAPVPPAPSTELSGVRLEDVGRERSPSA